MEQNIIKLKFSNLFSNLNLFVQKLSEISPKYLSIINILELNISRNDFKSFLKTLLNNFESICESTLLEYDVQQRLKLIDALKNKEIYDTIYNTLNTKENQLLFEVFSENHKQLNLNLNKIINFTELRNLYFLLIKRNGTESKKISGYKIIDNEYYITLGDFNYYKIDNNIIDSLLEGNKVSITDIKGNNYQLIIDENHKQERY